MTGEVSQLQNTCTVIIIDNLAEPFSDGGLNSYKIFDPISNRYGIYMFFERESGRVLYVGEAYHQDLKYRITQNYTKKNTGGTFRKNWCETEGKEFNEFKGKLFDWKILAICRETNTEEARNWIHACEITQIGLCTPLYNK